ncbi:MAG: WecB/TagA/CpsF family glycosyltransferase [Chloroflexota bacterium]
MAEGEREASGLSRDVRAVEVLGVRVDDVTYLDALVVCQLFIAAGGPHLVATVNTEFVMAAQADAAYRRVLNEAALCVPDGIGLLAAARLTGHRLREHVRGTDLVDQIASLAAVKGYRLFLLGGRGGVGEQAARALVRRWPGLHVAGWYEGEADPAHDADTLAAVRAVGQVDILLVAYGAPAQEKWLARNLAATGAVVGIGVGGVFDFFAGHAARAPRWARRLELEWLYRLLTQPWRWRRQLALPKFVGLCLARLLTGRVTVREVGSWRAPGGIHHQP